MSIIKNKFSSRISWIIFIFLVIQTAEVLSSFTDLPRPPVRPERFRSRQEIKDYLQLAYKYYGVTGGRRLLRSVVKPTIEPNGDDMNLYDFYDNDNDKSTVYDGFEE